LKELPSLHPISCCSPAAIQVLALNPLPNLPPRPLYYSIHAVKRSAIKQDIAFERSAKSATQLVFPIQTETIKRRIAVSGA